jgi:DNA-binding NtrC family response regulator
MQSSGQYDNVESTALAKEDRADNSEVPKIQRESIRTRRERLAGPKGAAAKLGIPRQTLDSKIANLNIDKWRFKNLTRYIQLLKASSFAPAITAEGTTASL